jgi:hypothetical protein
MMIASFCWQTQIALESSHVLFYIFNTDLFVLGKSFGTFRSVHKPSAFLWYQLDLLRQL